MVVLSSSALRGWSALTSLLLEWGQSVGPVHRGLLETPKSAMVSTAESQVPSLLRTTANAVTIGPEKINYKLPWHFV